MNNSLQVPASPDHPRGRRTRILVGLSVAAVCAVVAGMFVISPGVAAEGAGETRAQQRLEAAVANGRITQEQADRLAARAEAGPKRRGPGVGRGPGIGRLGRGPGLEVAAEAIGISQSDLREALRSGKSIAEVAADNDVPVQTVIDAVVAGQKAQIDKLVERLPEMAEKLVERKFDPEVRPRART